MNIIKKLFSWYGKRNVIIAGVLVVALVVVGLIIRGSGTGETVAEEVSLPTVAIAPAGGLSEGVDSNIIGTVEAVNEAEVETESAGRVVAVAVDLGDTVSAGQVLVRLESSAEAAAVLQAEGSYEAALAAAAQSDVGVEEARIGVTTAENNLVSSKNNAVDVARNSYTSANDIVRNTVDNFFEDPNGFLPGLLISGEGRTNFLNSERVAFQTLLEDWRVETNTLNQDADLPAALDNSAANLTRLRDFIDVFIAILPEQNPTSQFSAESIASQQVALNSSRSAINSFLNQIDSSKTSIQNAEESLLAANESLRRAEIGGSNATVSAADAQVKQALGSLRSAQSALAKKVVRSPIAGQVNKIDVNVGDFLGSFAPVATVANNNALEITAFISESDRELIEIESEVLIEGGAVGVVTNIAPAVDAATKKIEVKIATEAELFSGDTVTVTLPGADASTNPDARLFVPIAAVKFTASDGSVFTVADNVLVTNQVEIGEIRGSLVEIISGIEADTLIVTDARGLSAGNTVEPVTNN